MNKRQITGPFEHPFLKGGPGSGNFGHSGRPGELGGSSSEGGSTDGGSMKFKVSASKANVSIGTLKSKLQASDLHHFIPRLKKIPYIKDGKTAVQAQQYLSNLAYDVNEAAVSSRKDDDIERSRILYELSIEIEDMRDNAKRAMNLYN